MNYFIDGADFVADAEEDSVRQAVDGIARHFGRWRIAALVVAVEDSVSVILAAILDGRVVAVVVVFLIAAGAGSAAGAAAARMGWRIGHGRHDGCAA